MPSRDFLVVCIVSLAILGLLSTFLLKPSTKNSSDTTVRASLGGQNGGLFLTVVAVSDSYVVLQGKSEASSDILSAQLSGFPVTLKKNDVILVTSLGNNTYGNRRNAIDLPNTFCGNGIKRYKSTNNSVTLVTEDTSSVFSCTLGVSIYLWNQA